MPADPHQPFPPALCLRCGEGRRLAWARCESCGATPSEDRDRAAHLLAMDLDPAERRALSVGIGHGEVFVPDPVGLEETLQAMKAVTPRAVAAVALAASLPVVVLLLVVLAWLLLAL